MAVYSDMISKDQLNRFFTKLKAQGLPLHDWAASTDYKAEYIVTHDSKIYKCNTAHTSSSTFDATKWDLIGGSDGSGIPIQEWATNVAYAVDDIVIQNYALYSCIEAHTSSVAFDTDATKWTRITGDTITLATNSSIDNLFT